MFREFRGMLRELRSWHQTLVQVPPGSDDPEKSLGDAGKQTSAFTLTFIASVVYIAITAASVTDENLLLNASLTLPVFDIGVPIKHFFFIAPLIITFLHLNLLIFEYIVAFRIYRLPESIRLDPKEADEIYVMPSITMRLAGLHNSCVTLLIKGAFLGTTVLLPIAVLVLIQAKFLPYQSTDLAGLHAGLISMDFALVWSFFVLRPRPLISGTSRSALYRVSGKAALAVLSILSLFVIWESWSLVPLPEDCAATWIRRNLVVRDRKITFQDFPPKHLRCGDFSGSQFEKADFRGVDLRRANLVNANLQGANFSPVGTVDLQLSAVGGRDESTLHLYPKEELMPADLEGANLSGSNMREANLRFVNLRDARLEYADLRLADLSSANLGDASLMEAQLFGAELKSASLRGARLQGAQLQGANLRRALAEFASFVGAVLDGADLSGMSAEGADFRNASLQRASGLMLKGVDLRQANVAHMSSCQGEATWADLTDIRKESTLGPLDGNGALLDDLSRELSKKPGKAILARLVREEPTCQVVDEAAASDNDVELAERAKFQVEAACQRGQSVQNALVKTLRERLLVDPRDSRARLLVQTLAEELRNPKCPDSLVLSTADRIWIFQEDLSLQ